MINLPAIGTRVVWRCQDRHGYGFSLAFPGEVVAHTRMGRVRVKLDKGRTVTVKRDNLNEEPREPQTDITGCDV